MPFFDADKFHIAIELDAGRSAFVGGVITGVCRIQCTEPATARGIVLGYKTHFQQAVNEEKDEHAAYDTRITRKGKHTLHSTEYVLFGSRKGAVVTINPSTYTYPISIPVPHNVPPTLIGNAGVGEGDCCRCCCDTCNYRAMFIAVTHALTVRVIIAYSLKDATLEWPVAVRVGVNEDEFVRQQRVAQELAGKSANCVMCCPLFAPLFALERHDGLVLSVEKGTIALDRDAGIHCWVHGTVPYDFSVVLMSRQRDPAVCDSERIWVRSQVVRRPANESHVLPDQPLHCFLDLRSVVSSLWNLPSFAISEAVGQETSAMLPVEVSYFVALEFVYPGFCAAPVSVSDIPAVPVRVVHSADRSVPPSPWIVERLLHSRQHSQPPLPPSPYGYPQPPQMVMMGGGYGGAPQPPMMPHPAALAPPMYFAQKDTVYQYVPPPASDSAAGSEAGLPYGQAAAAAPHHSFSPACPVQEPNLPPAVWGQPMQFFIPEAI